MNLKENNWKIWLIQSTFGRHDLPPDLCSFVKLFVPALLLLPFAWIGHITNLILKDKEYHIGWGFLVLVIGFVIIGAFISPGHNGKDIGMFYQYVKDYGYWTRMSIAYLASPLAIVALLICIGLIISIIVMVAWPFMKLKDFIQDRKHLRDSEQNNNWLTLYYKGLKEKYCVKITYTK